jgi:predicted RNA-binding protein YlxR (DUF448 family)
MKLYHGSNKIIKEPKYNGSRDKTDFGRGFYLTANEDKVFFNGIKDKVKLYQRKNYDNERYIEEIQEVINNGIKC